MISAAYAVDTRVDGKENIIINNVFVNTVVDIIGDKNVSYGLHKTPVRSGKIDAASTSIINVKIEEVDDFKNDLEDSNDGNENDGK